MSCKKGSYIKIAPGESTSGGKLFAENFECVLFLVYIISHNSRFVKSFLNYLMISRKIKEDNTQISLKRELINAFRKNLKKFKNILKKR